MLDRHPTATRKKLAPHPSITKEERASTLSLILLTIKVLVIVKDVHVIIKMRIFLLPVICPDGTIIQGPNMH